MEQDRLFNLSSFSMMVLGILVGAAALAVIPNTHGRLWVLRVQALLAATLLLVLGVLFKLFAALRVCSRGPAPDVVVARSSQRKGRVMQSAGMLFLVIAALNLGLTFRRAPAAADVAMARTVSADLAMRVSDLSADILITGMVSTVAYMLLAVFSLASALTTRHRTVAERTEW